MLPDAGLMRGHVVGCSGSAAWSLALALTARATATGSWLAIVGASTVGVEAAAEYGNVLEHVVSVAVDGGSTVWAERVGAAADGFELIATCPPVGAERVVRKVRQRIKAKGAVLLAVDRVSPSVACDLDLSARHIEWVGLGQGSGRLLSHRVAIRVAGRRSPLPVEREFLLPGPTGALCAVDDDEHRFAVGSAGV